MGKNLLISMDKKMPSKYCRECRRIVSCNYVPNYCPWGCGSLKNEPLIPKDVNLLDYLKRIHEQSEAQKNEKSSFSQLKLF